MTAFLKGDDTAIMTLALAEGFDYSGRTVCLEYQGVVRSFPDAAAGDVLSFAFTAGETAPMALGAYPVRVWIEGADGSHTTVHNSSVKFRVTDNPADVRTDGEAIYIDAQGSLHGIEGLPARWTESDLRAKVNEIIRRLGGAVAAFALCALSAFGAGVSVQSAPKGAIYNDAPIVTNVVFDASGLATESYVDAKIAAIPGGGVSTNEVLAIVGPTLAAAQAQFAATGTVANANYAVRADSTDTAFSAYWLNASGSYLKWGGDRWGYDDTNNNFHPFAYLSDIDAATNVLASTGTVYRAQAITRVNGGELGLFNWYMPDSTKVIRPVYASRYASEGTNALAFVSEVVAATNAVAASLSSIVSLASQSATNYTDAALEQFAPTGFVFAASILYEETSNTDMLRFLPTEGRWGHVWEDPTIGLEYDMPFAYLAELDFSTNNTALVETIAATAGGGKASGLELVDENDVAWTLGVNTNGTIFTYIKEANP